MTGVRARDLETGRRLAIEVDDIRRDYERAVEAHIEQLGRACAETLGDYHVLDTREAVDAVMNAEQSLQAAIAIRDKVVSAYLEISRIQI